MRPAIDAVLATGTAVAEVALCYTGDLLDPAEDLYTLDYYLRLAEQIVDAGAHILAIKDMAGLLRAGAAEKLVTALRDRFDLPVHVHTHDTAGGQLATLLAASRAGADAVDVASAPMAGTTQPAVARPPSSPRSRTPSATPGISLAGRLRPRAVLGGRAPRRTRRSSPASPGPTGRVYKHEIPGGQLSNLRQQAIALGLGDHFEKIEDLYAAANRILGRPPKVTPVVEGRRRPRAAARRGRTPTRPTSRQNPDKYDIPDSVIGFMAGELGDLPGGWPEPFRTKVLAGRTVKIGVDADHRRRPRARWREPRRAPRRPQPAALPGADAAVRSRCARPTATSRSSTRSTTSTVCKPGVEHVVEHRQGRATCTSGSRRSARPTTRACAPS